MKHQTMNRSGSGKYQCVACHHAWTPRKKIGKPSQCPNCDTPYWEKPQTEQQKREYKCLRCDWKWATRKKVSAGEPAKCPHCWSPAWNKPRKSKTLQPHNPVNA